jgi:hypothetical protein
LLEELPGEHVNGSMYEVFTADWDEGSWQHEVERMQEIIDPATDTLIFWQVGGKLPRTCIAGRLSCRFRGSTMMRFAAVLAVLPMLGGCLALHAPPVAEYEIRRATAPVQIDGDLSDPAWQNAAVANLVETRTFHPEQDRRARPTAVRMLYDDVNLYLAFEVTDTHLWNRFTKRDEPIYEDEVVEAFLCPSGQLHYYYEFQVSPHNVVFDAFIINRGGPLGEGRTMHAPPLTQFTANGMQTAVRIRGGKANHSAAGTEKAEGWDVEIAIPFASIPGGANLPPKPCDEWRGNLYRIERPTGEAVELQALSPTLAPDYHRPGRFAVLRFGR